MLTRSPKFINSCQMKQNPWTCESIRASWRTGERKRRNLRVLPKNTGYFVHVTSRARGQDFLFGTQEKTMFVKKLRQWAAFSDILVINHCVMDNHFHLLLWVPLVEKLPHELILKRLAFVWPEEKVLAWEEVYKGASPSVQTGMDQGMVDRMGNLPEFMRVLKRTFSCWYNGVHDTSGTLWDSRYRSVVVEDAPLPLLAVSAYIDLNPVRAGVVSDPKRYPASGFANASRGDKQAQWGFRVLGAKVESYLLTVFSSKTGFSGRNASGEPPTWGEIRPMYECWLMQQNLAQFKQKILTRGLALGSPEFLQWLAQGFESCFGPNRKRFARSLPEEWGELAVLRKTE